VIVDHQAVWTLAQDWLPITRRGFDAALLDRRPNGSILTQVGRCGRKGFVISITSKSRYAVVALAELARSGDRPVPIKELAERRDIPEQFLEQLFSTLRRGGLLTSHRGMRGGYTLSRPAEEITVLDVVQTLDGKVGQEADEAGGIWAEGVTALRKVFGQTTIAEVARREAEEAGSGMYFI
jgi:Rrf2 family transcriptional regulator, cysteine metabolism repressor